MKLIDALATLRTRLPDDAPSLRVALACGFSPLHLQTFLGAHLRMLHPRHRVEVQTGLFDDALGNVGRLAGAHPDAAAIVLEWPDLDPRLGLRQLGGWGPGVLHDIISTVADRASRFVEAVARVTDVCSVALALPTLPLPPVFYSPGRQAGAFELDVRAALAGFAAQSSRLRGCRVLNAQRLDRESPPAERRDVKAELSTGFPYRLRHADIMAGLLARLLGPAEPKKGLITDLDDTLWRGILGDVGSRGISWDLDHCSQIHGLYQQFLRSLAEAGILLAVASKNSPSVVDEALGRHDLILSRDYLYPIEVSWGPKSEAVTRILRAWNIAADSVLFIDDSPMERAEVQIVHPDLECLAFPPHDAQQALMLFEHLRDCFGKDAIAEEDALRLESLRQAATIQQESEGGLSTDFLAQAHGELILDFAKDVEDARALELINKTNQFNLNGRRLTEGSWRAFLNETDSFLLRVSYQDKYGPLGTIAVVAGRQQPERLAVDTWVMSCRAFSRRIEHHCVDQLFNRFRVEQIAFAFEETPRNGPLRDFLAGLQDGPPAPDLRLNRQDFADRCPPLVHCLKNTPHG